MDRMSDNDRYVAKSEKIDENTQALESFLRGGGFVHYDEKGLHFLETDFGLLNNTESKA